MKKVNTKLAYIIETKKTILRYLGFQCSKYELWIGGFSWNGGKRIATNHSTPLKYTQYFKNIFKNDSHFVEIFNNPPTLFIPQSWHN